MTPTNFCYWLQGYFELHGKIGPEGLSQSQADLIQKHLSMVFEHSIDPAAGSVEHQQRLSDLHGGTKINC